MKKLLLFLLVLLCGAWQSSAQCTATATAVNSTVCSGDSVYLTAAPTGQVSYEWFQNGVSQGMSGPWFMSMNLGTGTYTFEVEITDANNCTIMSAPVTITVTQAPVITVANNGPLCVGSTLQLSSTISNATTFNWWGPNSFASTSQNPTISNIQTNQAGYYYLAASNGGCSVTAVTQVVVNGNTPTVVASIDSNAVCVGSSSMLQSAVTNLTSVTYAWTGPNSFTSTSPNPFLNNVTLPMAGVYTCTVTGNSCSGSVTISDTALLTVGTIPTVTATGTSSVCVGGTISLTGTVSGGTYSWSGPAGFTSTSLTPSITNAQLVNGGTYTLYASDNGCSSSDAHAVSVLSNSPSANASTAGLLCTYDSMFVNGASIDVTTSGMTGMTYSWSGPNSFSSTTAFNSLAGGTSADAGTYTVTVTGTGCSGTVTVSDQVLVSGSACDSVWPGDANNGFDVNNWDLLNIGLAYGATGTARTGASTNWVAQYAADWGTTFNNSNLNHKYADCNGDGTVNGADSAAVILNYGQWHSKGTHVPMAKTTGVPDLFFDMTGITLTPGASVTVPIKLGTSSVNMQNIYGIAASVKITGIVPTVPMEIASSGWMGSTANSMAIDKSVANTQTDWTLVRTDHNNITGDGTIALLSFNVPMGSDNQNVLLYFDNVRLINKDGIEITQVNVIDDNSIVYPTKINATVSPASNAVIVPNPSDAQANLQFSLNAETKLNVVVTDITGRMVWNTQQTFAAGAQALVLPSQLAPGMYNVRFVNNTGTVNQNLKWIKK